MSYKNQVFRTFTLLCSILFITSLFSEPIHAKKRKSKYIKLKIKNTEEQSLVDIISMFVKDSVDVSESSGMVKKTKRANKKIKDWDYVAAGKKVKVYIRRKYFDRKKYKRYKKTLRARRKSGRTTKKNQKEYNFKIFSSFGSVTITDENDNTLGMGLMKFGASYSKSIKSTFGFHIGLGTVNFTDIDYSQAKTAQTSSGYLPEINAGIHKSFGSLTVAASYDYLNYFVITEGDANSFNLTPEAINRLSLRPSYKVSDFLSILVSAGYITGPASGIDYSLGVSLTKTIIVPVFISASIYSANLTVEERKESSSATLITAGLKF